MNKLIRSVLACSFIVLPILLFAQNSYPDKNVNFPTGRFTLKATLQILSDQTGCVFSYDPTRIIDKQELTISKKTKLSLESTLKRVLPKGIHYKFNGKYVVLLKMSASSGEVPVKTLPPLEKPVVLSVKNEPVNFKKENLDRVNPIDLKPTLYVDSKKFKDSINEYSKTIAIPPVTEKKVIPDSTIALQTLSNDTLKSDFHSLIVTQPDTFHILKPMSKVLFDLELAENNHLATFSAHIGLNNLYSIISIGSDYYKSYHLGIGAGISFKLSEHFATNIDLIQYTLVAGRSFKIKVRAATTQLCPDLSYSIGQRLKIFAGPCVYLIKSHYINRHSFTDLGSYVGYSALVGVRFDLTKLSKKNI
ncbi:MAG: hypothetical protein P4L34_06730 [Paludibacter sp.]|nr:hypothetical protein [Paludibacter sp.]